MVLIAVFSGLVAGAGHVWSGPDHLAAIAPLAVRRPRQAWIPGFRWGIGHSAGVAVVGVFSLMFREMLPLDLLSSWGERLVGLMLIGIGLWGLQRALKSKVHVHEHEHDGDRHMHIHTHLHRLAHDEAASHRHTHAAMGIGILHGLAGSSHLLGILPMLAFPTRVQACAYLAAFAAGTICSMTFFSWTLGYAAKRCANRGLAMHRTLIALCGVAAMVIGCVWIVQTFGSIPPH